MDDLATKLTNRKASLGQRERGRCTAVKLCRILIKEFRLKESRKVFSLSYSQHISVIIKLPLGIKNFIYRNLMTVSQLVNHRNYVIVCFEIKLWRHLSD